MLVASLQVAASKCCHAVAMPAGGPEPAAGREDPKDQARPPLSRRIRAADRTANRDRLLPRRRQRSFPSRDTLRLAHRRDQERTDTRNTSGMYRFFLLGYIVEGGDEREGGGLCGARGYRATNLGFGCPAGEMGVQGLPYIRLTQVRLP